MLIAQLLVIFCIGGMPDRCVAEDPVFHAANSSSFHLMARFWMHEYMREHIGTRPMSIITVPFKN